MELSILIPVHTAHLEKFNELFEHLKKQVRELKAENKVEILYSVDSGQLTTGAKRNQLLDMATGEYVVTIDADDFVTDNYLFEFLKATESGADCFGLNGWMTTDNEKYIEWRISKDYQNVTIKENGVSVYLRTTNHITGTKLEYAKAARFTDKKNGEDKDYSIALHPFLKTEYKIHPLLYHYRFISKDKLY